MTSQGESLPLSVVVITLNEEQRLRNLLRSLPRGSEVIILDSGSTDGTAAIAKEFGAQFYTRRFTNHAEQKNAAAAFATRTWVLSVDADEVLSPSLRDAITQLVTSAGPSHSGYEVTRRLIFMNKKLRFGKSTDFPLRLYKRGQGAFHSEIHERVVIKDGTIGRLKEELDHFSYDSLEDYFKRFNWYTGLVASNHVKKGKEHVSMPAHVLRPWFEFIVRYFIRGGFLDGYPGYTYALLSAFYTFVKYAKFREMTRPELKQS